MFQNRRLSIYVYKSKLHLCPYLRAIHYNWNMESTIYSQCSNPRRSSSTRKKRSIDENREVIKLRTTQTIADPKQQSSFMKNVLSIFTILALFYWTKLFLSEMKNWLHVLSIMLYAGYHEMPQKVCERCIFHVRP